MTDKISRRPVIRIVSIYALFGGLWIFLSDTLLELLYHDPATITRIAMFKGLLFIFLTSSLLYLLINRFARQLAASEQSLRESEERFRSIFDLAAVGVALVEPRTGNFVRTNSKFCDITGYSTEELLGKRFQDITHPDDRQTDLDNTARLLAGTIKTFSREKRYIHKNGSFVWINLTVSPLWLEGQEPNCQIAVIEDITARKKSDIELADKSAELERFAYTVSHDLKSPLITVQSYAGYIKQDLEKGQHSRIPDDLKRIADASAKMCLLLDDLLELSRAGRKMNPPSLVDMFHLVKDVLDQLAGLLKHRRIEVSVQADLPSVHGDRQRIAQVLQNLVENAAKYMGEQPSPRIEIGTRRDDGELVFFVRDNGGGIDPRHHESIFGLFNKLDAKSEGTGIGLALVKRIIEVHGGRAWVESEGAGRGSTFCFTLPGTGYESG